MKQIDPRRPSPKLLALAIILHLSCANAQDVVSPDSNPAAAPDAGDTVELTGVQVKGKTDSGNQALYLDEKRIAPVVTEALSAEQIARTGDSDAATTLKRVPGLSLINGRYIYVRGLGERYSSVLLNGAQIPSPDFTRRVVPLDLFPNELLDGIVVQKSYSPEMPAEFGGGTVLLRTREVPRNPIIRVQGTLGYADGTTYKDGLRYDGGDSDWLGYDDGNRDLPGSLASAIAGGSYLRPLSANNPHGATPEQLQTYGRDLVAGGFGMHQKRIGPNGGFSLGLGNGYSLNDDFRLGVIGAIRYNQQWDTREEIRNSYSASDSGLTRVGNLDVDSTERSIDTSAFIGLGLDAGKYHHLGLTLMQLRQTDDRTRVSDGVVDSVDSRFSELKWVENQLAAAQLTGKHMFPGLHDLDLAWQYTKARASRDVPNQRNYRYDYSGDLLEYSGRSDANATSHGTLDDSQDDYGFKATLPFYFDSGSSLTLSAGLGRTERDRDSAIRTFSLQLASGSPLNVEPGFFLQPIDDILRPANIRPDGFVLREVTRPTDNYFAEQTIDSGFFNADLHLGAWRFVAGARREKNDQYVTTFDVGNSNFDPIVSSIKASNWLPAAGITWAYSDNAQLRLGFSRTLSRPDFRELSPAPFTDPELDIDTIGNPDLKTARMRNLDLRWEYYFGGLDSLSVSVFQKKFENPIEKLRVPGSTPLLELANAESADNLGIEIDVQKDLGFISEHWLKSWDLSAWRLGFNYARIRSDISLDPASAGFQTNLSRPMQGQSPYVTNLQLGYTGDSDEANLLFNRFGRRISEVGVQGQPDIYEESFNSLDFLWRHQFSGDWRMTLRLRNLLDPDVQFTQGGLDTRTYRRGREALVSLEWRPSK
ncbi:MAG: TonB-dependent receptor [Dokdonella sp.]